MSQENKSNQKDLNLGSAQPAGFGQNAGAAQAAAPAAGDQKIQLTVIRPEKKNTSMVIDMVEIGHGLRRFLSLWLALAIICAVLGVGAGLISRRFVYGGNAIALVETSMASTKMKADITALQTGVIVETAMNNLSLDVSLLDKVRNGLSITGVMSSEAFDQMTLYYKSMTTRGATEDLLNSMLKTGSAATRYVISFDYREAGYDRATAVQLLNEIVLCYRDYFERTYNSKAVLGNSVAAVDYTSYDYSEAVTVFRNLLNNMRDYLQNNLISLYIPTAALQTGTNFTTFLAEYQDQMISAFRSSKTGFTLQDLLDETELTRDTELSNLSAFVNINSVTSRDTATQTAHYQWLIEEETRKKSTAQAKYDSLKASVVAYKKDPVVFTGTQTATAADGTTTAATTTTAAAAETVLDAYDTMIQDMVTLQEEIAGYNTTIRYYQSVIDKLSSTNDSLEDNNERANELLSSLNTKVQKLASDLSVTMEEYLTTAVKSNALNILVPANARTAGIMEGGWVRLLLIAEVALLLGWIIAGTSYGIRKSNRREQEE